VSSSSLNSEGRKVRRSRGVWGSPALKDFTRSTAGAGWGTQKFACSNAACDGFALPSQGLGRKLHRLLLPIDLVVLDVATVKEFPRLASRSGYSRGDSWRGGGRIRGRALRLFPSDTLEIGNVRRLTEEVALEGWEIRELSFELLPGESFGWFAKDFPSHR